MNSVIRVFNYNFYVKEFLILFFSYLFMEPIFSWIFTPVSAIVQSHQKIVSFIIYGCMLYYLPRLAPKERVYIIIVTLLLIRLVFVSLFQYGTVFQQLTMFYVIFPVVYTVFVNYLCRTWE